ncbi:MAG: EAL domain-containing protein [Gallionella sp.]|nr:EAL domain-containing protein [Gallionella sp.]
MTLFKQLSIGISLGFLFLLAGIELIYIGNAKTYLQNQLTSHSQDAATSLGMILPLQMESGDEVRIETTINAVFDRGFYQSILVINGKGETVVLKQLSPTPPDVPEWFTRMVVLQAPVAESMITKGWRQMGRVIVSSHPNFAYQQLYKTTVGTSLWLLGLYVVCVNFVRGFLRTILRPLEEIESVAKSISERDFKTVVSRPKTRELKSVVAAINSLSGKIRAIIEGEVAAANRFRQEANIDDLTQLDNRRSFESKIKANLDARVDVPSGVLYLIQIGNFKEFNADQGYKSGDELLKKIGAVLSGIAHADETIRSRINGATFVLAVFNLSRAEAAQLGELVSEKVGLAIAESAAGAEISYGCGGAFYEKEVQSLGNLMAVADMAMLQSMTSGRAKPVLLDCKAETDDELGSQHWKKMILEALAGNRIALLSQPAMSFDGHTQLQYEVVGRLIDEDGELVAAAKFVPMAIRHHLTAMVDQKLLEKVFQVLESEQQSTQQVAINLFIRTVDDKAFTDWLFASLAGRPNVAKRIVFEFAEFGVVQNLAALADFVGKARQLGADFAVDNFGLHHSAFEYLQTLRPAYIKLSASFIIDLINSRENQFFISSIVKITKPLEIKSIAMGVENEVLLAKLKELGVDGYQGYATGELTRIA